MRIHCSLTFSGASFEAFTCNLSESGVYVIVRGRVEAPLFAAGELLRLRLELPDSGAIVDCPSQIAWVDFEDLDTDGTPATGLGLSLQLSDARFGEQLRAFVESFRYQVLFVGTDVGERTRVQAALGAEYAISSASDLIEAYALIDKREFAVLIAGSQADDAMTLELLEAVSVRYPRMHAIRVVVSRAPSVAQLRELVNRGGLFRSLPSDANVDALQGAMREAADRYAINTENERLSSELERTKKWLERENAFLRQRITGVQGFDKIIGNSPQLKEALRQLERIRRTDAPVYIHGETGTGKELVARALHAGGPRAERPYVVQNCAGMTETLLQSTLFGHRKGAFTGADRDHRGVFLEADGGTLFLDEVGELSSATQAMLLRALQEGEVTPVGASRPVKVDVRIISATHKDLREEVKAGRFREDLLYRLVVVTVRLPSLRERQGDVALLSRHFLDLHCESYGRNVPGFRSDAIAALEAYAWPGNVRELDNEIERMVILAEDGHKIGIDLLAPHIASAKPPSPAGLLRSDSGPIDLTAGYERMAYDVAVEALERQLIVRALETNGGSVTKAADTLGIERSRLGKIRKRLGID